MKSFLQMKQSRGTWLAQLVELMTLDLGLEFEPHHGYGDYLRNKILKKKPATQKQMKKPGPQKTLTETELKPIGFFLHLELLLLYYALVLIICSLSSCFSSTFYLRTHSK